MGNMAIQPAPRTCSSSISTIACQGLASSSYSQAASSQSPSSQRCPMSALLPCFSATDSSRNRLAVLGLLGLMEVWQFLATTNDRTRSSSANHERRMDGWQHRWGAQPPVRGLVADQYPCIPLADILARVFWCCFVYVTALSCVLACRICWFSCFAAPSAVLRSAPSPIRSSAVHHTSRSFGITKYIPSTSTSAIASASPSRATQPYQYQIYQITFQSLPRNREGYHRTTRAAKIKTSLPLISTTGLLFAPALNATFCAQSTPKTTNKTNNTNHNGRRPRSRFLETLFRRRAHGRGARRETRRAIQRPVRDVLLYHIRPVALPSELPANLSTTETHGSPVKTAKRRTAPWSAGASGSSSSRSSPLLSA